MSRKTGVITVNLNAGTAKFVADMDAAQAKIKQFGQHGVSDVQATSAALRVMEGNMTNNLRAAERFTAQVLGLGPVLKLAFPLVGAVALGGVLDELGKKAYEFYRTMANAPERVSGAFRTLNEPLRLMNDELAVANDRLSNDIAKLEGRTQNTLASQLDEARLAADRLADSLDKDLASLHKMLEQEQVSAWASIFLGTTGTNDITEEIGGQTGFGGFRGSVQKLMDHSRSVAGTPAAPAAQASIRDAYKEEIAKLEKWLENARAASKPRRGVVYDAYGRGMEQTIPGQDNVARIELLEGAIRQLQYEETSAGLMTANAGLSKRKEGLQVSAEEDKQQHPFEARMAQIGAQLASAQAKLEAAGKSEAAQAMAKAFGEAQVAIVEVNKALATHGAVLTEVGEKQIRTAFQTIAEVQAETTWREKLAASAAGIADKTRAQELLTAAIGKGYEATRAANVETRLMQELGQHFGDADWMQGHAADVARLRSGFGGEFDAQQGAASAGRLQQLAEETRQQRVLAAAQIEGAEAVRQAALAGKLRELQLTLSAEAFKKAAAAEMELYAAGRENANAGEVKKIQEQIRATEALTAAMRGGAAAVREATLANQLAQIASEGDTPLPGLGGIGARGVAAVGAAAADYSLEAAKAGAGLDRVQAIEDQKAKLEEAKKTLGDTLPIEIALRDLENQRLQAMVQQTLKLRDARDGVKAFFLEMREDAKSAAEIVYDALNSTLDKTSDNLAKLMTGQHAAWGAMFKSIGEETVKAEISGEIHKGLGALGGKINPQKVGPKKPLGTATDPLWVRILSAGDGMNPAPGAAGVGGVANQAAAAAPGLWGSIWRAALGLAGSFGSSGTPNVTSTVDYGGPKAAGGGVEPGTAYKINENEQEYFIPGRAGTVVAHPGRGGGDTHIWNVDARGSDLGAANRIHRMIEGAGRASASAAVRAMKEHQKRVPARG